MTTNQVTIDHDLLGEMVEADPTMIRLREKLHKLRTQQLARFGRRGGLNDRIKANADELASNRRRIFRIGKTVRELKKQIRPLQKANLRLRPLIARLKTRRASPIAPVTSLQNAIQHRRDALKEEARIITLRKTTWNKKSDEPSFDTNQSPNLKQQLCPSQQ